MLFKLLNIICCTFLFFREQSEWSKYGKVKGIKKCMRNVPIYMGGSVSVCPQDKGLWYKWTLIFSLPVQLNKSNFWAGVSDLLNSTVVKHKMFLWFDVMFYIFWFEATQNCRPLKMWTFCIKLYSKNVLLSVFFYLRSSRVARAPPNGLLQRGLK